MTVVAGPPRRPEAPRTGAARPPRRRPGAAAAAAVALSVLVATLAAFGWLYVLRRSGAIAAGPELPDALPLQRLAGGAAQPLSRVVLAWLPAGVVAGLALKWTGLGRRGGLAGVAAPPRPLGGVGAGARPGPPPEPPLRPLPP